MPISLVSPLKSENCVMRLPAYFCEIILFLFSTRKSNKFNKSKFTVHYAASRSDSNETAKEYQVLLIDFTLYYVWIIFRTTISQQKDDLADFNGCFAWSLFHSGILCGDSCFIVLRKFVYITLLLIFLPPLLAMIANSAVHSSTRTFFYTAIGDSYLPVLELEFRNCF